MFGNVQLTLGPIPHVTESADVNSLMSAVTVRNVGKCYRIGTDQGGGYTTLRESLMRSAAAPMGSTLAALKLGAGAFAAARIGDSRIYVWQDGKLARLPHAQPAAEAEVARGEPPSTPSRHRATQALGITPTLELDAQPVTGPCVPGMQFLLCSDGLTEELDDARIGAIVSRTDLAAQECVDHLLLAALDGGGRDNITAVLVRVR